jgi:putative DNA methylase
MTMEDIRLEGRAGRLGANMITVVVDGPDSKEYRPATNLEIQAAKEAEARETEVVNELAGLSLDEPFAPASTRSISAQLYGVQHWRDLFTPRQRLSLATLGLGLHSAASRMTALELPEFWQDAISDALCLGLDRLLCFMCVNTRWKPDADSMTDAFSRFSISLLWDFAEANPMGTTVGGYLRCNDRIATAYDTLLSNLKATGSVRSLLESASEFGTAEKYDLVITDPPYYQAVSYADLSDFFYTWLRGFSPRTIVQFEPRLTDKTQEFVQHIREDKSREGEKLKYEKQMAAAFYKARLSLAENGRFVCVFAHKEPDAWETLASAIIRSGFVVTGSWPVLTEKPARQRGVGVAALASSVWLTCRPRPVAARPGWDNIVLEEMRERIRTQLRAFWDAGVRGPDFVWAATGPALEAYSKYPVVKKAGMSDGAPMR